MIKGCHFLKLLIGVSAWLLVLSHGQFSQETQSDIKCLKSIKDSLEDPFNYLTSSWIFDNYTEGFICQFTGIDCWHHDENRVLNIRLSDMGLKGQFPRGLEKCTSLVGLDLSANELTGPIPADISGILTFATSIDLSSNNLSGPIPAGLAQCSYLNLLNLSNNRLTGVIPGEIANLHRLRTLNVANNLLHGPIPKFVDVALPPAGSFANNSGLCGDPLPEKPGCRGGSDEDGSMIAAPIAGVCVAAVGFGVGMLLYVRKRNKKIGGVGGRKSRESLEEVNATKSLAGELDCAIEVENAFKYLATMFEKSSLPSMDLNDLLKATDNFHEDNVIGRIGTLYKAVLQDGTVLMVEKLQEEDSNSIINVAATDQFVCNATALQSLKHPHLLPPSGFCMADKERFLVYEYMVNGSLYGNLHNRISQDDDEEENRDKPMEWPLRLKIAKMSAKALSWLRLNNSISYFSQQPVSSKRILLDAEFNPRILLNLPTPCIDTNINESAIDGDDADVVVHSFGILLLELITGEEEPAAALSRGAFLIRKNAGDYDDDDDEVSQVLEVACSCVADAPHQQRPATMVEVYQVLRGIGKPRAAAGDDDEVIVMMPSDHGGSEIVNVC